MTLIIIPIIAVTATIISYFWVRAIDKSIKYYKEHPDDNPAEGWLDWHEETKNK
jgi:hypothetical protein